MKNYKLIYPIIDEYYEYPLHKVGDGDEIKIQGAIDSLSELGGGTVFLSTGAYHIKKSLIIHDNVTLCGEDKGLVVICVYSESSDLYDHFTFGKNCTLKNLSINIKGVHKNIITAKDGFVLDNVSIMSTPYTKFLCDKYDSDNMGNDCAVEVFGSATVANSDMYSIGYGIKISNADKAVVKNTKVYSSMKGIYISNSKNVEIEDVFMLSKSKKDSGVKVLNTDFGKAIADCSILIENSDKAVLNNIKINDIELENAAAITAINCSDISIDNLEIVDVPFAINVDKTENIFAKSITLVRSSLCKSAIECENAVQKEIPLI